jgi:hypothetical protein
MAASFNGAAEPMRAIRDLISTCEAVLGDHNEDQAILERAQAGFTELRALFGDLRTGEQIADAQKMREPQSYEEMVTSGARAMSATTAWPVVFQAGSAEVLSRACVGAALSRFNRGGS